MESVLGRGGGGAGGGGVESDIKVMERGMERASGREREQARESERGGHNAWKREGMRVGGG